jgi:glycosyltransferase involved in cell wall biosynthesis
MRPYFTKMSTDQDSGLIFFDITRLVMRVGRKTPTGVDRVELAYALEILKRHPQRARFIVALERMVQVVPRAVARRFLTLTDQSWRDQTNKQSLVAAERIAAFLSTDASHFMPRMGDVTTQANKMLLAANMLIGGALKNLMPRGLQAYSASPQHNVYIHVAGSHYKSAWIDRWLARSPSVSSIFLLHDIIPLTHPEYCKVKVPQRHGRYVRRVLKVADVVIANSTFTATALKNFAADKALKSPNIVVSKLGTSEVFEREMLPAIKTKPYFVFVGTIEPRKNHIMLLQVWPRIIAKLGADAPKLILVGKRGWENENIVDILERAHMSDQHILECNDLSDEALATLIRNARAALMPSHVEGYGLPVAEALSLGTPVICSDLDPFREIAGDVPEYVDPLAGRGWAKLIMEYTRENSAARKAQLDRIRTFRPPSWCAHFDTVGQVIETLCAQPQAKLGETSVPTPPQQTVRPLLSVN